MEGRKIPSALERARNQQIEDERIRSKKMAKKKGNFISFKPYNETLLPQNSPSGCGAATVNHFDNGLVRSEFLEMQCPLDTRENSLLSNSCADLAAHIKKFNIPGEAGLSAFFICGQVVNIVHIGETRLISLAKDPQGNFAATRLTFDHTLVKKDSHEDTLINKARKNLMRQVMESDEKEGKIYQSMIGNVTRVVGERESVVINEPDIVTYIVDNREEYLLVVTDGITSKMNECDMADWLNDAKDRIEASDNKPQAIADFLVQKAQELSLPEHNSKNLTPTILVLDASSQREKQLPTLCYLVEGIEMDKKEKDIAFIDYIKANLNEKFVQKFNEQVEQEKAQRAKAKETRAEPTPSTSPFGIFNNVVPQTDTAAQDPAKKKKDKHAKPVLHPGGSGGSCRIS